MYSFSKQSRVAHQADAIESKRRLLTYLRSHPQHLTLESYLCLTRILTDAGWRFVDERWLKGLHRLATFDAAALELEGQIEAERESLLQQTVASYRPATAQLFPGVIAGPIESGRRA